MKNQVVILWLMLSIAFMLLGFSIDWRSYISQFSLIENTFDLIRIAYEQLTSSVPDFPSYDVQDASDFFRYVGDFFSYLGSVIAVGAVLLVYVPFTFIVFIFHFIVCVLGYTSISPLEVLNL